ncbi:MAG: nitroreductase family protein [Polaromonas sp.]
MTLPNLVDDAINSRQSVRQFLPKPVPKEAIEHLLSLASRAPSGTNTQPWKTYVLQGSSLSSLVDKVCEVHTSFATNPALAADYKEE